MYNFFSCISGFFSHITDTCAQKRNSPINGAMCFNNYDPKLPALNPLRWYRCLFTSITYKKTVLVYSFLLSQQSPTNCLLFVGVDLLLLLFFVSSKKKSALVQQRGWCLWENHNDAFLQIVIGDNIWPIYEQLYNILATSWPKLKFSIIECMF